MSDEMCHCGKPLHYSNPHLRDLIESTIEALGAYTLVTVNDRTWRVPRHYIALHGLKAYEVASLGFEEVVGS